MNLKEKFLYFFKERLQLSVLQGEPSVVVKEWISGGHIMLADNALCNMDPIAEQQRIGADGFVTVATRKTNIPICGECQDRWKKLPGSPWKARESGEAKRP